MQTTFKLIVSDSGEVLLTPNTGLNTNISGGGVAENAINLGLIAFLVVAFVLATIAIITIIKIRKKSRIGFCVSPSKKTLALRSLIAIAMLSLLGYIGETISSASSSVNAIASNIGFSTAGTVTAEAELSEEDSIVVCGTDTISVSQALPAGYKLSMSASDLKLATNENAKIDSMVAGDELTDGTWGYYVVSDGATPKAIPAQSTVINSVSTATEANDVTSIKYCAKLAPETEPGTYESTISYSIEPNAVTYSLNYDANGGTFETEPEAQVSDSTIETSYDFVVTDIAPVVPEDSGLTFYGWSTTGDSLSDIYLAGETITVSSVETTLKAVYGYNRYTITYDKNTTDEVTNFFPNQYCVIQEENSESCQVKLTSRTPNRSGYTLLGWSKSAVTTAEETTKEQAQGYVEYSIGQEITITSDIELYAVWYKVSDADFMMELVWGEIPHDVDSHLVGIRNSDKQEIFHVYFRDEKAEIDNGTITLDSNLDVDDQNGYGPEVVTLKMLPASAYIDYTFYYYINNYSGESGGKLKDSGATITLTKSDGSIKKYQVNNVPGESDEYWNVFAIKNGQIVERNTFSNSPELEY